MPVKTRAPLTINVFPVFHVSGCVGKDASVPNGPGHNSRHNPH
jgi:hypothetical protein